MSKSNMVVAMGLVFLLVGSSLMPSAEAASCSIFQLLPCMAASKNAKVTPSRSCCANVSSMGKGLAGANCLCSLLYSSLAKSQGVNPKIAITIPRRCHLPVIKGYKCHGNQSSCAAHSDHPGTLATDQSYYLNCILHDAWSCCLRTLAELAATWSSMGSLDLSNTMQYDDSVLLHCVRFTVA